MDGAPKEDGCDKTSMRLLVSAAALSTAWLPPCPVLGSIYHDEYSSVTPQVGRATLGDLDMSSYLVNSISDEHDAVQVPISVHTFTHRSVYCRYPVLVEF